MVYSIHVIVSLGLLVGSCMLLGGQIPDIVRTIRKELGGHLNSFRQS